MGFKISFDPGLNATGWAAFVKGAAPLIGTIRPASDCKTEFDKLRSIMLRAHGVIQDLVQKAGPLECAGVEKWQVFWTAKDRQQSVGSMAICADVRGMLLGVCLQYTGNVIDINKVNRKKTEAQQHASRLGVSGSKDALDALHLGICAGFDRG